MGNTSPIPVLTSAARVRSYRCSIVSKMSFMCCTWAGQRGLFILAGPCTGLKGQDTDRVD